MDKFHCTPEKSIILFGNPVFHYLGPMEFLNITHFEIRLLVAVVFGALIGLERQWQHKMAGIKTNALVALGAAIFVVISYKILGDGTSEARIISQVVTGIGFLAGGVIIREGFNVFGINTAATVWCSGSVGCLAGMGFGYEAIVGTALVIAANILLRPLEKSIDKRTLEFNKTDISHLMMVYYEKGSGAKVRKEVLGTLGNFPNLQMASFENHQKKHSEPYFAVEVKAMQRNEEELNTILNLLSMTDEITGIKWELEGGKE
jgi:putative Mg2+ transporter-C (MgtC) family protein